ncbi:MAG: hypothetical protein PHN69_05075 [Candidatus Pacebacteria bacterium]|nr:hypothetical protein [Candidatus Paceibacterota bacterium]
MIIKTIFKYFDRVEDRLRARLSHRSILYAIIGGILTVLFWRAVWHTADKIMIGEGFSYMVEEIKIIFRLAGWSGVIFYEPITLIWTIFLLLLTGLFVSIMIGDKIILSGLRHEKRVDEKTEDEIKKEETEIKEIFQRINSISKDVDQIKNLLKK